MVVYLVIFIYRTQKQKETIDIIPIYIYNGQAYRKKDSTIYCTEIRDNSIDASTARTVDPFDLRDIDQVDYLFISQELEDMEK